MAISHTVFLHMRNVSNKSCRESQNTYFICKIFSVNLCHSWDNVENYSTARQAVDGSMEWHKHIECWIIKATNPHTQNT